MTNLNILKSQYEKLGEEIKRLEEQEAVKNWPKRGDTFFFILSDGEIRSTGWYDYETDKNRKDIGNTFRTEQEALSEVYARKVITELKQQPGVIRFIYLGENNCVSANFKSNSVTPDSWSVLPGGFGQVYYATAGHAQQAINTVGEERILKAAKWLAMGEPV